MARTSSANGNGGSKWIAPVTRAAIYLRDKYTCQYCGRDMRDAEPAEVTLDHLDTRTEIDRRRPKGLRLHPTNRLVLACRSCNSSRQDKPWRQFATGGAVERITRTVRRSLNRRLAAAVCRGDVHPLELELLGD